MRGDQSKIIPPPDPAPSANNAGKDASKPGQNRKPKPPAPVTGKPKVPVPPAPKLTQTDWFKRKDKDGDLMVSLKEYVTVKKGPKKTELTETFKKLDKNRDGFLTIREFKGEKARNAPPGGAASKRN